MVHLPTLAQGGGDDQPMRVPMSLHLLRRHHNHIYRLPNSVQTHVNVPGQPSLIELSAFHNQWAFLMVDTLLAGGADVLL